tara:strand:- start:78470 stop:79702 length:1233 start_codon:yes stop_codon:yes gene_type:complete
MIQQIRRLIPLLLLIFIDSVSYFIVIPVFLQLFYDPSYGLLSADVSNTTRNVLVGSAIALSKLAALIAAPLIGSLSDHLGRKKTLLICLASIIVGFALPILGIWQKSITLILLGRLISGIGTASQPIAQAAVADLATGKRKSYFLSLIAIMMTLSIIVGPLAGGYLSDKHLVAWFSIATPYWAAFLLSIISFMLISIFFRETRSSDMRKQMLSVWDVLTGLPKAIKQYRIGVLLLLFFCLELGWSQYYQGILLILHSNFHYTAQQIANFNAYMGVLMVLGLLILYPLFIQFLNVKTIMTLSMSLVTIGLIACSVFHNTASSQWIWVSLVAIFTGSAYVSLLTLISNRVSATQQGWAMGYTSTLLFSAWVITGFASGWLVSLHMHLPLYIAATALILASLFLFAKPLGEHE